MNFPIPRGLSPGVHEVSIALDGGCTNGLPVAIDMPLPKSGIMLLGLADGDTWQPGVVLRERGRQAVLSLWASGLSELADRDTVRVWLGDIRIPVMHVAFKEGEGWQINAEIRPWLRAGSHKVTISFGESYCNALDVVVEDRLT